MTKEEQSLSSIVFQIGDKELISFGPKGIKFYRENFPDYEPDDFAKKFLEILEEKTNLRFETKGYEISDEPQVLECVEWEAHFYLKGPFTL